MSDNVTPLPLIPLLESDDVFATSMVVLAIDRFSTECVTWLPATLRAEFQVEFGCTLPAHNVDKLMAGLALLRSDAFYQDPATFNTLAHALVGNGVNEDVYSPVDTYEAAWAIVEAILLLPPENSQAFSTAVRRYLGFLLREDGFSQAPGLLQGLAEMPVLEPYTATQIASPENQARQQELAAQFHNALTVNLRELAAQLQTLPLKHGSTIEIAKKLQGLLQTSV